MIYGKEVINMFFIPPTHVKPNDPNGYTIHEAELIYERMPIEDASTQALNGIYKKAAQYGDKEILDWITPIREMRQDVQKDRIKQKQGAAGARWRQNKALYGDDYTPRQKQIINGEVAYEDATGYEYRAIAELAAKRGDTQIFELMQTLRDEKKNEGREKGIEHLRRKKKTVAEMELDDVWLSVCEKSLLFGQPDYTKFSKDIIDTLYKKALQTGIEKIVDKAGFLYRLYNGISMDGERNGYGESFEEQEMRKYMFNDYAEAIRALQRNTWFPLYIPPAIKKKYDL